MRIACRELALVETMSKISMVGSIALRSSKLHGEGTELQRFDQGSQATMSPLLDGSILSRLRRHKEMLVCNLPYQDLLEPEVVNTVGNLYQAGRSYQLNRV